MALQDVDYPLDYTKGPALAVGDNHQTAAGSVDRTAAGVQEFGAEFADNGWQAEVGEAVNQLKTFLDKSMREKPVATMAGAVALAYCIGAMLRKG